MVFASQLLRFLYTAFQPHSKLKEGECGGYCKLFKQRISCVFWCVLLFLSPAVQAQAISKASLENIAQEIAAKHNLEPQWVATQLSQTKIQALSIRSMRPAPGIRFKNWHDYRNRFITADHIQAGVDFWNEYRKVLEQAEKTFGIPAEIIVGILGVETIYGRNMGSSPVLDTLATLAFHFPKEHPRAAQRARYFRSELGAMLALAHRAQQDPFSYFGSYAGAMGKAQFMPSSWQKYAVDFDEDGDLSIDLFSSAPDAIGSIANYLAQHGWQQNLPTHYLTTVRSSVQDLNHLLESDILPGFTQKELADRGVNLQDSLAHPQELLALVELRNDPDGAKDYVAGTKNFYTITRYNQSSYYAMAVIELGAAIKARLKQ